MNTTDFLIVHTLYEYKNITHTAQALFLTQSTVSKRLKTIEEELGISIASRGKNGVTFTPEGEYLAIKAAQVNAIVQELQQHIHQMKGQKVTHIAIGVTDNVIHGDFPDIAVQFQRLFPNIRLDIVNDKSTRLTQLLEQDQLAICFANGDVTYGGTRLLLRQEQAVLGSAEPLEPERLPGEAYIASVSDPASRAVLKKWWEERFHIPFPDGLRVSGAEVARDLVTRGMGYSFFFLSESSRERIPCVRPLTYLDGTKVVRNCWCLYNSHTLQKQPEALQFLQYITGRTDVR